MTATPASNPARGVTPGLPTNTGSFKATEKADAGVDLGTLSASGLDEHDVERLQAAIEGLGPLDEAQAAILAILLDPANYDYPADIATLVDFGSYEGFDAYSNAQQVADALRYHYYRQTGGNDEGAGEFTFGWDSNSEGEIGMYSVGVYLGTKHGMYLTQSHDTKHLSSDRSADGLKAALLYAESIDGDYQRVVKKAKDLGLLPENAPVSEPMVETLIDPNPTPEATRTLSADEEAQAKGFRSNEHMLNEGWGV